MNARSIKILESILDFINVDLDDLEIGDKVKIAIDLAVNTGQCAAYPVLGPSPSQIADNLMGADGLGLNRTQSELRDFYEQLLLMIERATSEHRRYAGEKVPQEVTSYLRDLAKIVLRVDLKINYVLPETLVTADDEVSGPIRCTSWTEHSVDAAVLRVQVQAEEVHEALKYHLVNALSEMPVSALKQCPECQKYFLHLGKRERIFCSSRCTTKYGNRRRYQELKKDSPKKYKAELERGRERAKKSAKKQTRRKLKLGDRKED